MNDPLRRNRRRRGFSLLEVVAAAALMALALVPALVILRDGMRWTRDIDTREKLLLYAVSKLEEHAALTAATWSSGSASGDFAADGHSDIRFTVTRSDNPVNGGLTDQLMAVVVTTFADLDHDAAFDVGEPHVVMTTKIGKFASYESEVGS